MMGLRILLCWVFLAGIGPAVYAEDQAANAPEPTSAAHKVLELFSGNWNYSGTFRLSPRLPVQVMSGRTTHTVIYGGRFLKQEAEGEWMGPFRGVGYLGYDTMRQEYVSTWVSTMGNAIMAASGGKYDPQTKTLSVSWANSFPPNDGNDSISHSVWKIVDDNHSTYTTYTKDPDGQEFTAMELHYVRA